MSSIIKSSYLNYENLDPIVVTCNTKDEIYKANEKELVEQKTQGLKKQEESLMEALDKLSNEIADAETRYNQIAEETSKMVLDANKKVDKLLEDAKVEGLKRGMQEGKQKQDKELELMKKQLDEDYANRLSELDKEKEKFLKDAKEQISEIIIESFQSIFRVEAKENNLVNLLVTRGLRELTDEKEVRVLLSEEDYKSLDKEELLNSLKDEYNNTEISFSMDKNLINGSCLLETSLGYIDCSLQNLSRELSILICDSIEDID